MVDRVQKVALGLGLVAQLPQNVAQHQHILEAALAKDEDAVSARIEEHLSRHLIRPIPERVVA